MVQRPRPCNKCGEYGTGTCDCGGYGGSSSSSDSSSNYRYSEPGPIEKAVVGTFKVLGCAAAFSFVGGCFGMMGAIDNHKMIIYDPGKGAIIGAGVGLALYVAGKAINYYEIKKWEERNEKRNIR